MKRGRFGRAAANARRVLEDTGDPGQALQAYAEERRYTCECLDCEHTMTSRKHCRDVMCPECGGEMRRKERPGMGGDEYADKTKEVSGRTHHRGDFLVVEDPDKVTTWHLPVKVRGEPDRRLMGAAWAALHEGYRGNKYQGPDKQKAIYKLRGIYQEMDEEIPGEEDN